MHSIRQINICNKKCITLSLYRRDIAKKDKLHLLPHKGYIFFQTAFFYVLHVKTVRFPIGERTVSISKPYVLDMETVKIR